MKLNRDQIKVVVFGVEPAHAQILAPILHIAMTGTEYYQENPFVWISLRIILLVF